MIRKKLIKSAGAMLSAAMSLTLAGGVVVPAYAVEETRDTVTGGSLTVDKAVDGHTYKVYQIFTGDVDAAGLVLSNIKYGSIFAENGKTVSEEIVKQLDLATNGEADAKVFAEKIKNGEFTDGGDISWDSPSAELTKDSPSTNLIPGYYLVIDEKAETEEGDSISDFVVQVVGSKTFTPKSTGAPLLDKLIIGDENDATVKYGVGDTIQFELKATMPESISAYKAYKLIFNDTLSDGLTRVDDSIKVFVGDTEIPAANYTVSSVGDTNAFTVEIEDVKAAPYSLAAGGVVSVKYSATLNDGAVFKNLNNAFLQYSNNPNTDQMGKTVSDDVTAFTFVLDINKVDKDGNALEGAGFTLYKKTNADGTEANGGYEKFGDEIKGVTEFTFDGLGVGDYKLVESTTPDGYNTMEDLEFSIVADGAENTDGIAALNGLKIVTQGSTLETGVMLEQWTADLGTGVLSTNITNFKGAELPSTGGIGTTAFYVVGGCIVGTVCIVLIRQRKKNSTC